MSEMIHFATEEVCLDLLRWALVSHRAEVQNCFMDICDHEDAYECARHLLGTYKTHKDKSDGRES